VSSSRNVLRLVALVLVALAAPASAVFNNPTLLLNTPTADVLPARSLAISADVSSRLMDTPVNVGPEANANVRFSPVKRLDLALTAYTMKDYVLGAKYQLAGGEPERFALAVGVCDVGLNSYVSPIGHGLTDAWPDWKYKDRTMENFSAFVVTNIPVTKFARVHVGLGRGRFVGYDGLNGYLNTDIFFKDHHQWAVSAFGGLEVFLGSHVALCAESDSRDANAGVKANVGPVTATLALNKIEGLVFAKGNDRFGRLAFDVSYQVDNLFRSQEKTEIPLYHVQPAPEPEQLPVAAPSPAELKLSPIYFDWDKSDITTEAAAILRANADQLKSNPNVRVMITGRASEEGPLEYNLRLAEQRAAATFEYLKSLGVPAGQMSFRGLGEEPGKPLPSHRVCHLEIQPEK